MSKPPPAFDLCQIPAGLPPLGSTSNLVNPPTLIPVLISVSVIMSIGAIFFTTCRLIANRRKLWWSDYFAIIALLLSLCLTGLMLAQTRFARHQWDVRACWYNGQYIKILYCQEIILPFVLFFSKGSLFLLYYQMFDVEKSMRIAITFGMVFSGVFYVVNIPLASYFTAPHVGETWSSVLLSGRPQRELIWGVVQSAVGILLDLYIFILPLPIVVKLHLTLRKKMQLVAVFTTALVGVIASVLSLVYRIQAIGTNDGTWKYTSLLICNMVEGNIAIIISCTPGVLSFARIYISGLPFVKLLGSIFYRSRGSSSGGTHKPSKEDPNRPRTRTTSGKNKYQEFSVLSESDLIKSQSSARETV